MSQFSEKLKGVAQMRSDIIYNDDIYTFLECHHGDCVKYYSPPIISRLIFSLWDEDRDSKVFFITNTNFDIFNKIAGIQDIVCSNTSYSSDLKWMSDDSSLKNKYILSC